MLLGNLEKLVAKVKVEMEEVKEQEVCCSEKICSDKEGDCHTVEKKKKEEVKKGGLHQMPAGGLEW